MSMSRNEVPEGERHARVGSRLVDDQPAAGMEGCHFPDYRAAVRLNRLLNGFLLAAPYLVREMMKMKSVLSVKQLLFALAAALAMVGVANADTILTISCRQFKGIDIAWDAKEHPAPYASDVGFVSADISIEVVPGSATATFVSSVSGLHPMRVLHINSDLIMLGTAGTMVPIANNTETVTFYPKSSLAVFVFSAPFGTGSASTQMAVGQCRYDNATLMKAAKEFWH
jgi:hypothetical protein